MTCIVLVLTVTLNVFATSNNIIHTTEVTKHMEDVFTATEYTNWFEQGNPNAQHQLYIIAEPNCSACHYLYESIRPYIHRGMLKVRWIMVAFLKPSSLDKAATIVSVKNPAKALEDNESTFNLTTETGGIAVTATTSTIYAAAQKIVINNTKFMKMYTFQVTPIILFKSISGKPEILRGAPKQNMWPKLLPYIGKYS